MATQIRGNTQIKDSTINWEKLEANLLDGVDLNVTAGNNDATITGLKDPVNANDAANKQYVDQLVDGSLKTPEAYDASVNAYPATYGGAAIEAGDSWRITVAGTMGTRTVNVEDLLIALVDGAGADADFMVAESNRDQASETVKGVAEIATQAETDAGTDDLTFVTPLKLHDWFTGTSLAESGLHMDAGSGRMRLGGTMLEGLNIDMNDNGMVIGGSSSTIANRNFRLLGGNRVEFFFHNDGFSEYCGFYADAGTGSKIYDTDATGTSELILNATDGDVLNSVVDYVMTAPVNQVKLNVSPDGTVPLSVATVEYVTNSAAKINEVAQEDSTLAGNIASGATVYTLTQLGTHATVKVIFVKAYVNGILQKVADTTVDTANGDISFAFDLVTGDEVSFTYSTQDA